MTEQAARINKQHLELITEVRALAIAVNELHLVFVKRKVLFWAIGILTGLVIICVGGLSYLSWSHQNQVNRLITKLAASCQVRNDQVAGTNHFIRGNVKLQDQSAKLNAVIFAQLHLTLTPAQQAQFKKLSGAERKLLTKWETSQPGPVRCKVN